MNVRTTERKVHLSKLDGFEQVRVQLEADILVGPFNFWLHKPVDTDAGFAITESRSRVVVAWGITRTQAFDCLRNRLIAETVQDFIASLEANEQLKQSTLIFRDLAMLL